MNVYDKAHELARALRESEEYREYMRLKDVAYADSTNKALLDEYKRLQFKLQAQMASGMQTDDDDMQRLTQIAALLQLNHDVSDYLLSELRYQRIIADIFGILGEVAGIDPEMFAR